MSIPILDVLHDKILEKPDAQILHVTEEQRVAFYVYLQKFHLLPPPPYGDLGNKLTFLGRKLEAYVPEIQSAD